MAGAARALTAYVIAATPVVRRGLAAILAEGGWEVLDDRSVADVRPDIVVHDVPRPIRANAVTDIVASIGTSPLLVIVDGATAEELGACVAAGARGAVDREVDEQVLRQAAHAVAEGRTFVNASARTEQGAARPPTLTRREAQVLSLLGEGCTNHEIAENLVISENTVKNHVRRLYEKLQVRSRTEAVVKAAGWGLLRIDAGS